VTTRSARSSCAISIAGATWARPRRDDVIKPHHRVPGPENDLQTIDPGEAILKMGRPTLVVPEEARTLRWSTWCSAGRIRVKHDERCGTRCPSFRRRRVSQLWRHAEKASETILANHDEISTACLPREHIATPPPTVADGMVLADPTVVDIKSCRRRLPNIPSQPRRTCIPLFEPEPHCNANGSNRILISH
jgi:hypothetical protein